LDYSAGPTPREAWDKKLFSRTVLAANNSGTGAADQACRLGVENTWPLARSVVTILAGTITAGVGAESSSGLDFWCWVRWPAISSRGSSLTVLLDRCCSWPRRSVRCWPSPCVGIRGF